MSRDSGCADILSATIVITFVVVSIFSFIFAPDGCVE
jgi:hypothetical protein